MEILKTDSLDTAVTTLFGDSLRAAGRLPVYGGDISQSCRLSLSDGSILFMKCSSVRNLPFVTAEAQGLEALRGTGTIGVPKPLAFGTDQNQGVSFLLMEYLELALAEPEFPSLIHGDLWSGNAICGPDGKA